MATTTPDSMDEAILMAAAMAGQGVVNNRRRREADRSSQPQWTNYREAAVLTTNQRLMCSRPDGGYVLSVSGVSADGTATASYFNPQPIRVARAAARRESDVVGLFVEFDHPSYRGSTYTLAYDPATDTLKGVYYQALQQARYEVEFVRQR